MSFSNRKIIFLAVILALLASAGFLASKKFKQKETSSTLGVQPFWAVNQSSLAEPVNEEAYRQAIKRITASLTAEPGNQAVIKDSYEKALALAVPAQYRQLHLSLVLALIHLGKPEQFEQGQAELERILAEESWLAIP